MTHTTTIVKKDRLKDRTAVRIVDLDTTSTSSATGESITTASAAGAGGGVQLASIYAFVPEGPTSAGWRARFNRSTNKMQYFRNERASVVDQWSDITGGIAANLTSDQAGVPEGSADVMALSDAVATTSGNLAHTAGKSTGITNPVVPRNVTITQKADTAGVTFTAANVVVTGTDQFDQAITDTIAIQTGAVASNNHRLTVGTKVFKTITNVRLTAAQPTNAQISVGVGTKIGLRSKLATPASADVKDVMKNTAAVGSGTYVVDTTNHAVDMGANLADNDDVSIQYEAGEVEAPSGTNVGSVRGIFYGVQA